MLVYANSFTLNPPDGPRAVIREIAVWLGKPRKTMVDPERLAVGIRELKLPDGSTLSSRVTLDEERRPIFPYYFCARLTHGQPGVPGRRWVAEVGIHQPSASEPLQCSVLSRTDEISARVTEPIQVTRPGIVQLLIDKCNPVGQTPGLGIVCLTEGNAAAFAYDVEHEARRHPLVQISHSPAGHTPMSPDRLQALLAGLAQVIEIPAGANTFKIEEIVGRKYSAFGGAINIILPFRKIRDTGSCKNILIAPDRIKELHEAGGTVEAEVLAIVTHHTNLPHSWRHVSFDTVGQALLHARLRQAAAASKNSEEMSAYEALLQEAAEQLQSKDQQINEARTELEKSNENAEQLAAQIDGLKYALSQSRQNAPVADLSDARKDVLAALEHKLSVEQALRLTAYLFPDRLIVMDSAINSAKEADRAGSGRGAKAFELLRKLVGEYWSALADGQGDQQAKAIFGKNAFAAKESETLSVDGRRRRTFNYAEEDILMEKHLKHGVKDSAAETLRVHFEWMPDKKKIIIGHCGKHLNF